MTLTNPVRKRVGTRAVIEFTGKLTSGTLDPNLDVIVVRYKDKVMTYPILKAIANQKGALRVPDVKATDAGPDGVEICVERMPKADFYNGGEKISNVITLK